jgi:hypothetical protein
MDINGVNIRGTGIYGQPPTTYVTANLVLNLDAGLSSSFSGNSTWVDTINGYTFSLLHSPTYNSDYGGYINFVSASEQHGYTNSAPPFGSLSTWTVEAWHYYINNDTAPIVTDKFPLSHIPSAVNSNFYLGNSAGFLRNNAWQSTANYSLSQNAWYQMVGTFNGTDLNLYVNNNLVQSAGASGIPISGGQGMTLMSESLETYAFRSGRLSIVRIYNTALSNVQIDQNYQAVRSRFGI